MSAVTTPSPIVALLEQAGEQLERWARDHRRATLAEHEQGVLRIFRQLMGATLGAVLQPGVGVGPSRARRGCDPAVQAAANGGSRAPGRAPAGVEHLRAGAHRAVLYYCKPCRRGWAPADATLELAPYQALSAGSQHWLTLVGGLQPFRPAAALLDELTGLGVGAETVRGHTEAAGRLLDRCRQAATAQVVTTGEPVGRRAGRRAAGGADGWGLHPLSGRLARGQAGSGQRLHGGRARGGGAAGPRHQLVGPSYLATRLPAQQFGPQLLAEAARRGALAVVGWEHAPGERAGRSPGAGVSGAARGGGAGGWRGLDLESGRGALWAADRDRGLVPRQRAPLDLGQGAVW